MICKAPAAIGLTQTVQQHYSPVGDCTRLCLHDRAFAFATVSQFTWSAQPTGSSKVFTATSPSVISTTFSVRHAKLVPRPASPKPISLHPDAATVTATSVESSHPVRLSEIIISRAIELEAEQRSNFSAQTYIPKLSNAFCVEAPLNTAHPPASSTPGSCSTAASSPPSSLISETPPPTSVPSPILQPATYGPAPDASKINIKLLNASPADLNQARWLFSSVLRVEHATLYTRLVEQRAGVRDFHLVTTDSVTNEEGDQVPLRAHEFRLLDPWHVAWRWLALRPAELVEEAAASYLAAVGLTWAPVPRMIEASWIYELCVHGEPRTKPSAEFEIDCAAPLVRNPFMSDTLLCGFEGFLKDVVAFWRGLSWPLDMNENVPAKQELKAFGPLRLKQIASKYCGDRWILGEVPVAALVKGAWDEISWRRSWIQYAPSDLTINLPSRLRTLAFEMSGPAGNFLREKVYVNGYATYFTTENSMHFRVGISGAGFFLGDCNLFLADIGDRTGRQRNSWLFDVTERFTLTANSLEIIFCAAQGANLKATYDESYARMFDADQFCFGAITDWPRSCFARPDPQRQHQIVFSINDKNDLRGRGVYELLQALNKHGGLLHISCDKVTSLLAPSSDRSLLIPRLATSGAVGLSRSQLAVSRSCIGRIHCEKVSAGIYTKACLPTESADAAKLAFVRSVLLDNEEVEVCSTDRNAPRGGPDQDQLPIPLAAGVEYSVSP